MYNLQHYFYLSRSFAYLCAHTTVPMKDSEKKKPAKKATSSASPKKTTRRKATPAKDTPATDEAPADEAALPAKKKKTTPRKTTRRKAAPAEASTPAAEEPLAEEAATAPAPAKKKSTRSTPHKATRSNASPKKETETEPAELPVEPPSAAEPETPEADESALMINGLKFFSQLAQTLNDKEATARLVSSITTRDEKTGQTYLKVPVENEKTIEDAFMMLGTLFKALQ